MEDGSELAVVLFVRSEFGIGVTARAPEVSRVTNASEREIDKSIILTRNLPKIAFTCGGSVGGQNTDPLCCYS